MKKNCLKILTVLSAALLLLCGCFEPSIGNPPFVESDSLPLIGEVTVPPYHESETYDYHTQVDESLLATDHSREYLMLVNKLHSLDADYVPSTLVRLGADIVISWQEDLGGLYLESRTAQALLEMIEEMKADGIDDIWVTSAYRDYAYQTKTFNGYIAREASTISEDAYEFLGYDYIYSNYLSKDLHRLSVEDARRVVLSYSAAPGTSEHQSGLCLDFTTEGMQGALNANFEDEKAFEWLSKNAYKFGFIMRYSKDKESITGYTYEPWHYRFVGREAATDIYFSGVCLEEYLVASQS